MTFARELKKKKKKKYYLWKAKERGEITSQLLLYRVQIFADYYIAKRKMQHLHENVKRSVIYQFTYFR